MRMILRLLLVTLALAPGVFAHAATPTALTLADQGKTHYTIIIGNDATDGEKFAADDLAKHLKQMTDVGFPVKIETAAGKGPFIFVGPSNLLANTAKIKGHDLAELGQEELLVRTSGQHLVLAGGRPRGSLYAVYSFLEDDLGCHWWTSKASTIPYKPTLKIDPLNRRDRPFMEYRLPAFSSYMNDEIYCIRNRISAMQDNPSESREWPGGRFAWANRYCHSFDMLVPAKQLMEKHPDWFSKGTDPNAFQWTGQLCLTNPEVEDYVVEQLKKAFREHPEASIASVSQNDNQNPCTCDRCGPLAKKIAQSGLMVSFLSRVAAKLKPEFPDKILHTFAYQYTQSPPLDESIRVDDNVCVQLTTEGVSHAIPLRETKLKDVLERWSKIAKRVYIWDYQTNFLYHQAPIPNLLSLGPNYKWFQENHVRGMLIQGGHRVAGEFSDLRGWMAAKLMWNPSADAKGLMDEFLKGYYGEAAAPYLWEYINLLQETTCKENWDMYVYLEKLPSFDWKWQLASQRILTKAEDAAKDNSESLLRVRTARMQVDYMLMLFHEKYLAEAKKSGQEWPAEFAPDVRARAFFAVGEKSGIAAECGLLDEANMRPLGERAGTWADFRDKCNLLLASPAARTRMSVLSSAAAKACELMRLDVASNCIRYLQKCAKAGNTEIREGPIDAACPKLTGHKVGAFEDWDNVPEAGSISRQGVDLSDLSGSFRLGWDSDYLYVLANVSDDIFAPDAARHWTGDGIEVYFNMLDDAGIPKADGKVTNDYGPDDFHFGISADGVVYDYDSTSLGNPLGLGAVPGIVTKHKRTDEGYLLEIAVPWKSMFLQQPHDGYTFGFTIALDDLDTPGQSLKCHLLWKGSMAYQNTSGWGRVELKDTEGSN